MKNKYYDPVWYLVSDKFAAVVRLEVHLNQKVDG